MRDFKLTLPELASIAGTRAAFGAGLAFLVADRLPKDRRMAVGWTLVTIGVLSTIPLGFEVLGRGCLGTHRLWPDDGANAASSNADERSGWASNPFAW
jgi:hypothetical protein